MKKKKTKQKEKISVEQFKMSGKHLPDILKDFHDQKDVFKSMHWNYEKEPPQNYKMPNWMDGAVYIIDWFLWYMATYGYTLQKSRANVAFKPLDQMHKGREEEEFRLLESIIKPKEEKKK